MEMNMNIISYKGKIGRLSFFLNNLFLNICAALIKVSLEILPVLFVLLIFIEILVLFNVKKRAMDIYNDEKASWWLSGIFLLLVEIRSILLAIATQDTLLFAFVLSVVLLLTSIFLLFMPGVTINENSDNKIVHDNKIEKIDTDNNVKNNYTAAKETPYTEMLKVLVEYDKKINSVVFTDVITTEIKSYLKKYSEEFNEKECYFNSSGDINRDAVKRTVVSMLIKFLDIKLTSGEYHIYRGVLNDIGAELLKFYELIIVDFKELGIKDEDTGNEINDEWIDNNIKSLMEDINIVG